jgi:hypothetical protein
MVSSIALVSNDLPSFARILIALWVLVASLFPLINQLVPTSTSGTGSSTKALRRTPHVGMLKSLLLEAVVVLVVFSILRRSPITLALVVPHVKPTGRQHPPQSQSQPQLLPPLQLARLPSTASSVLGVIGAFAALTVAAEHKLVPARSQLSELEPEQHVQHSLDLSLATLALALTTSVHMSSMLMH